VVRWADVVVLDIQVARQPLVLLAKGAAHAERPFLPVKLRNQPNRRFVLKYLPQK
jgi:hypothetical protein